MTLQIEEPEKCPQCAGEITFGFGLAGGGVESEQGRVPGSTGVLRVFKPKPYGVVVEVFELSRHTLSGSAARWVWCWSRLYEGRKPEVWSNGRLLIG